LSGDFSKAIKDDGDAIMATKFAALLWRTKPESVVKACQASVNRLGGKPIDLYQIHFPNAYANAKYWDGFAMAYEKCLVQAGGGVSNYDVNALFSAMQEAASHHGGEKNANLPQVAINWCRTKGTIPIPGSATCAESNPTMGPWSGT
jgi:diketogulonate reductase-like aldo/keto reductase